MTTSAERCIHPGCVSAALHALRGREGLRRVCARHLTSFSAVGDSEDIAAAAPGSDHVDAVAASAATSSIMMADEDDDSPPRRGPYRKGNLFNGGGLFEGSGGGGGGGAGGRGDSRAYSSGLLPPPAPTARDDGDAPTAGDGSDDDDAEPIDFRLKRARTANHRDGNDQHEAEEEEEEEEEEERSSSSPQALLLPAGKARGAPGSDLLGRMATESPGAGFRMLLQTDTGWTRWNWHTALDRTRTTLQNVGE
ncbi:unnamed protein product [Ectocarpus sp. CCAP 1310/34]|nr:unnamed protein product [Ectocarpus sp. CCAP 1310/34]